ncbi:restriction endonuclease-related protein [Actinomadura terrae]|uniref:restriction endonuclease-related protein n=1 Tax=Actinomadura terrae TaxID=604353 RepID=UPI001FA6B291|nr:hypothetical protein [Actinomadura terrae]
MTSTTTLERAVTAAIRAGFAWTVRRERPESWAEIARMTGVIMRTCGPGRGPATPVELVAALRRPLGTWLPGCGDDVRGLVVLDADDELTDATFEIGCDYTAEVLSGQDDPGARWLPDWRVHRGEQIEKAAFRTLLVGTDEEYTRGRRFITEHPAGALTELMLARDALDLPALVSYSEIPEERQWRGLWWPCPVCRWPMRVRGPLVRCDFPRHEAVYGAPDGGTAPRLSPVGAARRAPRSRPADGAVCVDESVWRYIVVPGVVEVRLHDRLAALPGVETTLYPRKDLHDIQVVGTGEGDGWEFTLDVKDYASASALARRLEERPIASGHLVLPRYRRDQVGELRRLLPETRIATEDQIHDRIRRRAARQGGAR